MLIGTKCLVARRARLGTFYLRSRVGNEASVPFGYNKKLTSSEAFVTFCPLFATHPSDVPRRSTSKIIFINLQTSACDHVHLKNITVRQRKHLLCKTSKQSQLNKTANCLIKSKSMRGWVVESGRLIIYFRRGQHRFEPCRMQLVSISIKRVE